MTVDYSAYKNMQFNYYNNPGIPLANVIGNVPWHEKFPYETMLLFKYGDTRRPLFEDFSSKIALDFGCGPGRMISRMNRIFKRTDGCDISPRLIEEAKRNNPTSNCYVTNGDDSGDAPVNTYDFIYSTIAMHHIAVHSIRMNILSSLEKCLKPNGSITIQMGFAKEFNRDDLMTHATWNEDMVNATSTNAGCDVMISPQLLPDVVKDFNSIFANTSYWFYDCSLIWNDLDGTTHPNYWATHWIFINAQKR